MSDAPHNKIDSNKVVPTERLGSVRQEGVVASHEQQVAYWESELLRARGEAVIDGRSDWAAERYSVLLQAELPDEKLRSRALDGLAELAETSEGRVARRVLIQHYRLFDETSSVAQMQSLALRIGTSSERISVFRERIVGVFRRRGFSDDLLTAVSAGVDTRRTTLEERARALLLAYKDLQDEPGALSLVPLAIDKFQRSGTSRSVIEEQLVYLERTEDADSLTAQSYVNDVLAALSPDTRLDLLERAFRNPRYSELRARAALLLDFQEQYTQPSSRQAVATPPRPRSVVADIELGMLSPVSGASDSAKLEFEVDTASSNIDAESTYELPRPSRFRPEALPALEAAAKATPTQRGPLYTLARAYRELEKPQDELQTLGRLASLLPPHTAGTELADLYRRSSELLLALGDTSDALRIRIEGVFLSSLRDEDEQFVLHHCDVPYIGETLNVIRHLIEHTEDDREIQLSYLAAQILITLNDDPDAAWEQLFASWRCYPNDRQTTSLMFRLGADPRRAPMFHEAINSLAAKGAFRVPTLLKQLLSLAVRLGDDECLIVLQVNAAAVSPLDAKTRRSLEKVLRAKGRSRASGYRQVLALVQDLEARRIWIGLCAGALEAERRFSEAADQLLELYMLAPNDDELLDRALLNLEREQQWPRIIRLIQDELTSPRSARSTVARLRYLSRIARVSEADDRVALDAAVRTALLFPKEPLFDVHARVELSVHNDIEELSSYVEKRAQRLGADPDATELFLEAADLVASLPNPDPERMQRLWATARRAGVELRERDHQPVQRSKTNAQAPTAGTETNGEELTLSEHSAEGFWRSIVSSPPALRAERIGSFLETDTLNALAKVAPTRPLVQLTATELMPWLHGKPTNNSQHDAVRLYNAWSVPSLDDEIESFLNRIGAQEPLSAILKTALGDPINSLRVHSQPIIGASNALSTPVDVPVLIGFNSVHWLAKYTGLRLPELYKIVDESEAINKDALKERLAMIPWILAIYGSGSIISSYRSLMFHLGLPRALNLEELVQQMTDHPEVALLFAEWAYLSQR